MNRQPLQRSAVALATIWGLTLLAVPAAAQAPGTVWAWGDNGYGQLGDGTILGPHSPQMVSGLSSVVAIAAGFAYTLALKSDGTVWAWGANFSGQLGNGTITFATVRPVLVSGLSAVVAISAGNSHSLALKSDGTVWAWGDNYRGELGNGTNTGSTTPVPVSGLSGAVAIAAGSQFSLALKSDGTVWVWGSNDYGQLGNGTLTSSTTPVPVSGLSGAVAIAAGFAHSLALKSDGTVSAWGKNDYGQLGNGTNTNSKEPVTAWLLPAATAIVAGPAHSEALKSDGTVWAWGSYSTTSGTFPVHIAGLSGVVSIARGLALKSDGTVWAWLTGVPVRVEFLAGAVRIADGAYHCLALINPVVAVNPTTLDFGAIRTGSSSATQMVTITNYSPAPLTVSSLSFARGRPSEFELVGLPLPITLERGASIAAGVIFTPADVGQRNGTLFIGDDGFLSPQTVSLTGTGVEIADVAVAQSVVASGEQLTYTLIVKNNGPGTATNVTLADSLPAQTKLISASNGCSKGGITCSLGSMARGAQAAVTVVVQVTSAGPATISNTAVVSSASPDSNTANNSATLRTNWSGQQ